MRIEARPVRAAAKVGGVGPFAGATLGIGLALCAGGCGTSPLAGEREADLRRAVLDAVRQEVREAEGSPEERVTPRDDEGARLPIEPQILEELERTAGPNAYDYSALPFGEDLLGKAPSGVGVSLEHAIRSAVENNLEVQFARLAPAVSEAQTVAAEAAFDWTFFSNLTATNIDDIDTSQSSGLSAGFDQRQATNSTTGIRRALESGGRLTVQQELIYTNFETESNTFRPDPATELGVTFQIDQPLLRNFGSEVALAQVRLARNTERDAVARLRRDLIGTVRQTEEAYWNLVQAQRELAILQRLFERGETVRSRLEARREAGLDVTPSQHADAVARVERRRVDVRRAQSAMQDASDRLKVLMNDPGLPVGSEMLVLPVDAPVDEPLRYSLLDVLGTAVEKRPEISQAVLSIDNTSIRQSVAQSGRLPQLDLRLSTTFNGLDDDIAVYDDAFDGRFIDYLVGLTFEQPIGNREGEAEYTRRRLERQQAVLSYRNTVQQVVREAKAALRAVMLNYRVIEQTRLSRVAAAESLRALEVENKTIRELTSERLDLEFNRQESLAAAERSELQALTDFNIAVSQLHASMGTALERSRIDFVVPAAGARASRVRP